MGGRSIVFNQKPCHWAIVLHDAIVEDVLIDVIPGYLDSPAGDMINLRQSYANALGFSSRENVSLYTVIQWKLR